ncbi:selenocysteine-specific translation elongation factor [Orbus sturtevantii]|uniref:selenocysteine-specific translation elongation factor n=1 Tax=Orbus sturtevantii TaxID=3074109 RepID=UPI00370DCABF
MNAVIGTAGHVDHGKSSLINALTGIHPSHLPEELKRSMTIDLGFAYFITADNDKIGIIDVPGHERFIRNMVSAIWGLDLVLFVVAADEGWAPLSTEHLNVIAALGIRQVILVITKGDLADVKQLQAVEEQSLEHFLAEMDLLPDTMVVSTKTRQGIEDLKRMIIKKTQTLSRDNESLVSTAHLYVDRVFSVNGIGTTVTGTLRGGEISVEQQLTLFPGNHLVKIRSLQSYHQTLHTALPHTRTAIGLKQVNKNLIQRGSCLVFDPNSVEISDEWVVQLNLNTSIALKKQSVVEVALGTTYTQAKCYVYADKQLARLQLNNVIPAFWGQPLLLIQQGGSHVIGSGRLIWSQALDRIQRQQLISILPEIPLYSRNKIADKAILELTLNGFTKPIDHLVKPDDVTCLGDWWIKVAVVGELSRLCTQLLAQAKQAILSNELARLTGYRLELVEVVANEMCKQGLWIKIDGAIALASMKENCLSTDLQKLFLLIEQSAKQGFDASKSQIVGIRKLLRGLTQRDLIVPTENELFFSRTAYEQIVVEVMSDRHLNEIFNVADARQRTGLSRKQIIPIFNRLERDGWVKRIENDRQVCRIYELKN